MPRPKDIFPPCQYMGAAIRRARKEKGMTLKEVYSKAFISSGFLSDIEKGRKGCSMETLNKICDAIGIFPNLVTKKASAYASYTTVRRRVGLTGFEPDYAADTCLVIGEVIVGKGTTLEHYVILDGRADRIAIGENCLISAGVKVCTEMHKPGSDKSEDPVRVLWLSKTMLS